MNHIPATVENQNRKTLRQNLEIVNMHLDNAEQAMQNNNPPVWDMNMAALYLGRIQAEAAERQAAALERIASVLERADNLSKIFGGEA